MRTSQTGGMERAVAGAKQGSAPGTRRDLRRRRLGHRAGHRWARPSLIPIPRLAGRQGDRRRPGTWVISGCERRRRLYGTAQSRSSGKTCLPLSPSGPGRFRPGSAGAMRAACFERTPRPWADRTSSRVAFTSRRRRSTTGCDTGMHHRYPSPPEGDAISTCQMLSGLARTPGRPFFLVQILPGVRGRSSAVICGPWRSLGHNRRFPALPWDASSFGGTPPG